MDQTEERDGPTIVASSATPEGWVLVPMEPTVEMCVAALNTSHADKCSCGKPWSVLDPEDAWPAMLAAAPLSDGPAAQDETSQPLRMDPETNPTEEQTGALGSEPKLDWPEGGQFRFVDEPGEHEPCYVVMPDGAMLPLNHHAGLGVDIARARFIINACNAALYPQPEKDEPPTIRRARKTLREPNRTMGHPSLHDRARAIIHAYELGRGRTVIRDGDGEQAMTTGLTEDVVQLGEAVRDVVRRAWELCDDTETTVNGYGRASYFVEPDDWLALSKALTRLEELIPQSEQPASTGHAVTMLLAALALTQSTRGGEAPTHRVFRIVAEDEALLAEADVLASNLERHTVRRKDGTGRPAAKIVYDGAAMISRLASRLRSQLEGESSE